MSRLLQRVDSSCQHRLLGRRTEVLSASPRTVSRTVDTGQREQSAVKLSRSPYKGRPAIRLDRGRITRLLYDRMMVDRRTISYAFAGNPELMQRAMSHYKKERKFYR